MTASPVTGHVGTSLVGPVRVGLGIVLCGQARCPVGRAALAAPGVGSLSGRLGSLSVMFGPFPRPEAPKRHGPPHKDRL